MVNAKPIAEYQQKEAVYGALRKVRETGTVSPIVDSLKIKENFNVALNNMFVATDIITTLDALYHNHDDKKEPGLRTDIESTLASLMKAYAWHSNGDGSSAFKYGMRILAEKNSSVNEDGSISIEKFEEKYGHIIGRYNTDNHAWQLENIIFMNREGKREIVPINKKLASINLN